jgi:hypothetical protein
MGLGKCTHQGAKQRIEEFGRAKSWPFDRVADLLVMNQSSL